MKSYTLSPRLTVIADFAKDKKTIADIGCDHGKISVYLAEKGSYVHAVDISKPSLQKARDLAKIEGVGNKISFYCDDGLNSIKHIKLDAVIIAGMGWRMISSILDKNQECIKSIDTLVLQPMDSVIDLRKYICSNNYTINDEKLIWDDGRLYTVLVAQYKRNQGLSLLQQLLGPKILENKDVLINDLIEKELRKRNQILLGLNKAKSKNRSQICQIKKEIEMLETEYKR